MTFTRPPAGDDPQWPRASAWLSGEFAHLAEVDAPLLRVIGVPCSIGSISPSEAWRTPPLVREALARLSPWDPATGTDLTRRLRVEDLGDWDVAALPLQEAIDQTRKQASLLRGSAATHAFIGGDNAITRPVVAGLLGDDLAKVGVITLDAHHDVRHLDDGPRNGTPIRGLIEDGLDPEHVVQLGIGRFTNSAEHAAWCAERGIGVVTAEAIHAAGVSAAVLRAFEQLAGVDRIHLDIDIDVLDAAHAPACPGARPGGLTPAQLFDAIGMIGRDSRVVSADLVEVDPTTDVEGRTVMATAMSLLVFADAVANR